MPHNTSTPQGYVAWDPADTLDFRRYRQVENSEAFGPQPTSSLDLPDPRDFALRLVAGIIECVYGLREPAQFSRWVTEDVYRAVASRAQRVSVGHNPQRSHPNRPQFSIGNAIVSTPRDGVVEASVIVRGPARVRAVALRLEGIDYRWRATSFSML
ncbi:Rv3235 family protein [Pontimonas sp.]|jgi:hypothetical protein|uniref:Rv3235 family protein n=1 Tax=Pontimonas sp. TaxID=2304492 RepID=UPI00286FB8DA|nr:Rv3235 family protein [Pontimonas sp.]MDR9396685.1 Rv3235 family protein [Pontimonas sp.]MDR9435065.1 Rv3235 family protein [Pontimonas sp.]